MQRYKFIDIHTHKFYDDGTIFLFSRSLWSDPEPPRGVIFCAGMHPWSASMADLPKALEYLEAAPVAAIGEIGLDYAVQVSLDVQIEVFRRQLEIAARRKLPVVIHCVRAFYDLLSELKLHDLRAVIFHGFVGSLEQVREAIGLGYYLSFNERSLASPKTVESLRHVPEAAIFVETDTESEHVSQVYGRIAEIRETTVENLQRATTENFNRIFR